MYVNNTFNHTLKLLLIEDDEDDYVLIRDLLSEVPSTEYEVEWVITCAEALEALLEGQYDVCLLDFSLGDYDGLMLLHEATEKGCKIPIIFLTGKGDYKIDTEAMELGAADFLIKDGISSFLLERAIRYSIKQKRTEDALRKAGSRLEKAVEERTAELTLANEQLRIEIEERRRVEQSLKESGECLRFLSSGLLGIQEEERRRVAQELHDSIGQTLLGIKYKLESIMSVAQRENMGKLEDEFDRLIIALQASIEETRRICAGLRPCVLDRFGILESINSFCEEFEATYSDIRVHRKFQIAETDIPDPRKIVIFRILQEAMSNTAKHSRAKSVHVSLAKRTDGVVLTIEDNGIGFIPDHHHSIDRCWKGFGVVSMRERAELSGGSFYIESRPGGGTTVRALWPDK